METYNEQQIRFLKSHIKVAKQAKENNWHDLYNWSIKSAKKIIKEFEDEAKT